MNVEKVKKLRTELTVKNTIIRDEIEVTLEVYGHYLPEHKRKDLEELLDEANRIEREYMIELLDK